jgi:hypothetical protein
MNCTTQTELPLNLEYKLIGALSRSKNFSTVPTKASSEEAIDIVAGNTVCFCSGRPKMLWFEGLRR